MGERTLLKNLALSAPEKGFEFDINFLLIVNTQLLQALPVPKYRCFQIFTSRPS
jgi:hypothetical protein